MMKINYIIKLVLIGSLLTSTAKPDEKKTSETLSQLTARLRVETNQAYNGSPYSALSKDYFSRFSRNPKTQPVDGEVVIDETWLIVLPTNTAPPSELVVKDFVDFYHGMDHNFSHGSDMIRAKIELIDYEIHEFLPDVAKRCGFTLSTCP